jgi:hypothetical protein
MVGGRKASDKVSFDPDVLWSHYYNFFFFMVYLLKLIPNNLRVKTWIFLFWENTNIWTIAIKQILWTWLWNLLKEPKESTTSEIKGCLVSYHLSVWVSIKISESLQSNNFLFKAYNYIYCCRSLLAEIGGSEAISRKQCSIVPAETQWTHVQRLSSENKGVSPYTPLQTSYRGNKITKQGLTHIWLHVIL